MFGGSTKYGCYFLAVMIFGFGILRDTLYVYVIPSDSCIALIILNDDVGMNAP